MSFGTLAVVVLAGLGGPALGVAGHRFVPVAIGEILAGILVGPAVLGVVDPANVTISFLAQIGFAMLMLTVAMHLPLRNERLMASLRGGAVLALIAGMLAVPAGLLAAGITGTGHAAVYSVLLASGSAAILLPALQETGLADASTEVMIVMAQVTIADLVTILAVPLVLQPGRVGHVLLGGVLVAVAVLLFYGLARGLETRGFVHDLRRRSRKRHWVLDLRLSLLVLFVLAWIAQKGGTSILIAGFAAGVMVALIGGPRRLSTQMRGVADGFFIPLYFVVLGAQLDIGGLLEKPSVLALAGVLAALDVGIHVLAATIARRPLSGALAASAQLGVPAAIASLGLAGHLLSPAVATAIVAAALISLAVCTLGVGLLVRRAQPSLSPAGGAAPS